MADKQHSDTLEEQRRARREFLELKKMESGEMDSGPKPSEVAIVPRTPKEKLKNIWFHDKWLIIGGLLIAVVMAVMIAQCAGRTEYDLEVVAFTYNMLSEKQLDEAAKYMEQYCEDISGDGEVHIQIINCSYNSESGDKQYQYTMSTKLQAVLAADANALLFITDKDSYAYLNGLSEDASLFEGEPLILDEDFYKACDTDEMLKLPEGLQISCRRVTGTTIEKNKKVKSYLEQSENILKGLKSDS